MSLRCYSIGQLAQSSGCAVETIRYYERAGLLSVANRSSGNQRRFDEKGLQRLAFIRHCRQLGFSLEAIRELMTLADNPDQDCDAIDRIARAHLEQIESRLSSLAALKSELHRIVSGCAGGSVANCRIIESLADHGRCLASEHVLDDALNRKRKLDR